MDRAELLQRATRYRDLAARMTDEQTREGLLDLAKNMRLLPGRPKRAPPILLTTPVPDGLPTARTMLPQAPWLCLLVGAADQAAVSLRILRQAAHRLGGDGEGRAAGATVALKSAPHAGALRRRFSGARMRDAV